MLADAAWHDHGERSEIDGDVEREAVHRDPSRDAHADRADLREVARPRDPPPRVRIVAIGPDADVLFVDAGFDVEIARDEDHRFGERAHVLADVATIGLEIEDRIADELSGS